MMLLILVKFIGGFMAIFFGLRYWLAPRGVRSGSIVSGMLWLLLVELYLVLVPRIGKQFTGAEFLLPTSTKILMQPFVFWPCIAIFTLLAFFCFAKDRYFPGKTLETSLDLLWVGNIILLYYMIHISAGFDPALQIIAHVASPFTAP